jgi:Ca-activated chloride channel family protein
VREPPLENGQIEDLKGVIKVYVGAPDHYSSLFLREIVETVRKKIPHLVFVWAREDADVWLLFSVESNLRDASVRGKIIRSLAPGRLRLVKQYSAKRNKGAEGFAEEFVKSYRKANAGRQAEVAGVQQATSLPPRLKGENGPVAVTGGLTSVRTAGDRAEVGDGDILRTDTSLVTILANVIGRDGRPAPDMHQDDFNVYEDDVKQEIAFFEPVERPFTVVLLIDSSTSVDPQLREIEKAAKVLLDRLRPDDQLVIITFDAMVKEVLKLTKIRELRGESIKISPHGGTRLYDAVDFAASQYLRRLPGRKAVVLLTDGVDLGSFITTAEGSLHNAEEYDALFYTVQYKTSEDQPRPAEKRQQEYKRATAYLRELAEKTGGRYHRAEDMGDLSPAFASVVKELSCQYSLGYYPTRPPQPGERRRIIVRLSRSDLVIHTRDSYLFKSPEAKQSNPKE